MDSSTISLPCYSCHNCLAHGIHRSTSPFVICVDNARADVFEVEPSSAILQPFLLSLPYDLLRCITDHLEEVDILCLSLTCHWLRHTFSADFPFAKKSTVAGGGFASKDINEFLRLLARDLQKKYWHCELCRILHLRTVPQAKRTGFLSGLLGSIWIPGKSKTVQDGIFDIWVQQEQLFAVTYPMASAIMDRHFQKKKGTGICLESLRCYGMRQFFCTENKDQTRVIEYRFRPKVVLDRLLLEATYTWELQVNDMTITTPNHISGAESRRQFMFEAFKGLELWICKHMTMALILGASQRRHWTREFLRCHYCPTQFWVKYDSHNVRIEIKVWHNLGPCRQPGEIRWNHLIRGAPDVNEYSWEKCSRKGHGRADEDIWSAYNDIPFETRKGFEEAHGKFDSCDWSSRCEQGYPLFFQRAVSSSFSRALAEAL